MKRLPPGQWRLLTPAVIGWAVTAGAVNVPGSGGWVAVGAGALGAAAGGIALVARRRAHGPKARLFWQRCWSMLALSCAVIVLLGTQIHAGEWRRAAPEVVHAANTAASLDMRVTVESFVQQASSDFGERFWLRAALHTTRGEAPVLLWLDAQPDERWVPGATLALTGRVKALEKGSQAAFGMTIETEAELMRPPLPSFQEHVGRLARDLRVGLKNAAEPVSGAELVPGFAVGDTSLVSKPLEDDMLQSSLTHLTAVSGANCALVTSAIIWLASWLRAGRRLRILLAGLALGGFVAVVGPDPSVQRAAVMASVILISNYGGKRAMALPSLGLAMLVLLTADPWQALQPGFVLSVAATAGILLAVPTVTAGLQRRLRMPRVLAVPVAVALTAQLACGPLLLLMQPGIPAVGVLANVLAAPAAPLGTGAGLLGMLVLPFSEPIGSAFVHVAAVSARWVAATAEVCAQLPFARWNWPDGWLGALLLAGAQACGICAWALYTGRLSWLTRDRIEPRLPWHNPVRGPIAARVAASVLMCAAGGVLVGTTVAAPVTERIGVPANWAIVACDVGQGDAILLRDPQNPTSTMLIDTGDDVELLDECLSRFGVGHISLLVLTHDDRDHVGALEAVADISDAALVSPDSAADKDSMETNAANGAGSRPLLTELEQRGLPYRVASAGVAGEVGGISWNTIAPQPEELPEDTNAASIVLRVEVDGFSALLLADTGEDEHRALLAQGIDLKADVVKVAHHGSKDQDPNLLDAIGAEFGLISVGESNGYGHPNSATLSALRQADTVPLRTDQLGSIAISRDLTSLQPWSTRVQGDS